MGRVSLLPLCYLEYNGSIPNLEVYLWTLVTKVNDSLSGNNTMVLEWIFIKNCRGLEMKTEVKGS